MSPYRFLQKMSYLPGFKAQVDKGGYLEFCVDGYVVNTYGQSLWEEGIVRWHLAGGVILAS